MTDVKIYTYHSHANKSGLTRALVMNSGQVRIKTEKAMAPHFSTLAWKIPWTEEPGRLQSMGSLGVGHN